MELIDKLKKWFAPCHEHTEHTVVVHKDDTLSDIALEATGDASRWRELADANPDKTWTATYMLHPGETLRLPESWNKE